MRGRLTCKDQEGRGKQWMTGESKFGQLKGGIVVDRTRNWKLLLDRLKKYEGMQYAKGDNGKIWVKSGIKTMTILPYLLRVCRDLNADGVDKVVMDVAARLA